MSLAHLVPGLALLCSLPALPGDAEAIPAFARRYRFSCQQCHDPIPKLNGFGEQFAANGNCLAAGEEPRDTMGTGDELLALLKDVPVAVRLDLYAQEYADGRAATDFQTPYGLKLLSGGAVSKSISYFFLHAARDLAAPFGLGAFGYYGRTTGGGVRNATSMAGVDGTITAGPIELNGQYIYRRDTEPTFTAAEPRATMQGGFGEAILRPSGSRWYGFALYNLATANRPLLDVRLGGPAPGRRYETLSGGLGHLVRRNLRTTAELTYDLEEEAARVTLGIVAAF